MISRRTTTGPPPDSGGYQGYQRATPLHGGNGGAGGGGMSLGAMRQSLAPQRMSMAVKGGMGQAGYVGMIMEGMGGLSIQPRPSEARMSGLGRAMGPVSSGRPSQYVTRPSSVASFAPTSTVMKDPRQIRDKTFQANAIRNLINFLVRCGYPHPVSNKTLQAPSGKDFQCIFKYLYEKIDPSYIWQKKFEDDVPFILKSLRYPFADTINKSHLHSVGAMHAWPALLAMFTWMMELIVGVENGELGRLSDEDENEFGDPNDPPEEIFFKYVNQAYTAFLSGHDTYDALDERLRTFYERKDEVVAQDVTRLEEEVNHMEKEWGKMSKGESPLETVRREVKENTENKEKFTKFLENQKVKEQKFKNQIAHLTKSLEEKENQIRSKSEEKASYQQIVDAQEISPADVDRMTAERDQLSKTIRELSVKMAEVSNIKWDKEIAQQKKLDQLEKIVQEYNGFAYKLGLLRGDAPEPALASELELRVHASRADQMVSLDMRNQVKPALLNLRDYYKSVLHKAQDDVIALQENLDSLTWTSKDKEEELAAMESKIRQLGIQYKDEQERIGIMNGSTQGEIEKRQRETQRLKVEANGMLISSQQRLKKATAELEALHKKSKAERDRVAKRVLMAVEDLFHFQQNVHNNLVDLEKAAREECEGAKSRVEAQRGVSQQKGQGVA
ncbi:kinetochore-associated Ndc80 complex subunit ndc80 [Borealophlyctis nickersoniae]|nr:kinetochore-associated Ndc80 complex subunit ndc80 [Borealophlyctis nickersoniae]